MSSLPSIGHPSTRVHVAVRGLHYHCHVWGHPGLSTPERPTLVLTHGWMDVGASYQFLVDELGAERHIIAPDWRGFGHTRPPAGTDSYWFGDYLADLDALLRAPELGLQDEPVVDLCGHSMGGNVVMLYAGARAARIRRLINLEGFGLPARPPEEAPRHTARWLDELREPARMKTYASLEEVARRLQTNNPRLPTDRAAWLATHWSERREDGQWHILGDPAHKRPHGVMYRVEEVLATWRAITAPVLWVDGEDTQLSQWWGTRYSREEFERRLDEVPNLQRVRLRECGHMLHLEQPQALAQAMRAFLDAPAP